MSIKLNSSHPLSFTTYLTNIFFQGNRDAAKITRAYADVENSEFIIFSLVEKTISKESVNELTMLLLSSKNIQLYPDLAKYDLSNPDYLKKACLFVSERSVDLSSRLVAGMALHFLNNLHKINELDPITLDEIAEEDLFTSKDGQRFSVASLIDYHNARSYRGTEGEQHGKRFLLNPRTNEFFNIADSISLISTAIKYHSDKPILYLSDNITDYGMSLRSYYSREKERL